MASTSVPPYERLLFDTQQMSYQNTVIVRHDSDVCWLGNIQNISGDNAFIHFGSKKVKPSWIHTGRVWPLHFPADAVAYKGGTILFKQVFAALRDEDDGPFRFRPAFVADCLTACDLCEIFYVETQDCENANAPGNLRKELVYRCQIAVKLPITEPPLLCRVEGLIFKKLFVPLNRAQDVFSDASDISRIIRHFRDTMKRDVRLAALSDCCRFHLRIQGDGCMFIVPSLTAEPETMQWMATALSEMLLTHLAHRADLSPFDNRCFSGTEEFSSGADVGVEQPKEAVFIGNLPPLLLSEVFSCLDLHSIVRIKRVCVLWQQLLSSRRATEHIAICLATCSKTAKTDNLSCYKTWYLLSLNIRSMTKSLTVLTPFFHVTYLADLLEAMQIKLPTIVFKDYTITDSNHMYEYANMPYPVTPLDNRKLFAFHGTTIWLSFYRDKSQRIVLHNWKLSNIFGKSLFAIFCNPFTSGLKDLPAHEVHWMQSITPETWLDVIGIDRLQIAIPQVVLDCSQDEENMVSQFMWTLDNNFPPTADGIYVKVQKVHARWVETLSYPHEWNNIRAFLSVFSGFHADGTIKVWKDIDLRLVDVSQLSRMALLGIAELFRV
ncbi:uncharacterized protein LOC129590673 isoform X2 [Paramacrobiotus metropolitanus]|uniref:uncharacterized protein LOC129590673 isoform X2 n=1 Tax=Paramacrobiotus metropolitanus TaxID=2943436 RepID=UPI002445C2D4|nr:uncharacterized protein LOC129590673 isoform X2 [Paramacrobiotus metropolitanus]